MKVVFTIDALINAGTEKSILETITHFSESTHSSVVYFFPRHELKNDFEAKEIPLYFLNSSGMFSLLKAVYKFYGFVKKEKPDVIVSSLFRANMISRIVCLLTGTKLVGTFVSDSYSSLRLDTFTLKRKIGFYIVYAIDRTTSFIPKYWIANSESVKESNCQKLNINKDIVYVIYRGRDSKKFKTALEYKHKQVFNFISIGRLYTTKGVYELIEAFKKLINENPYVRLQLYGDGPEKQTIKTIINEAELQHHILIHGNKPDAWQYLYNGNCFVFPSHYEGFSGALVEAMMCGIPIIASDIPMNLEAVESGNTALIHKVKNVDELYLCMKKMIQQYADMQEMGMRARKTAMRRFDMENIAATYEQQLKTLIKHT